MFSPFCRNPQTGLPEGWLHPRAGSRGLNVSSLAKLLEEHFQVRNNLNPPQFGKKDIADWAKAHNQQTGEWPKKTSGPVQGTIGVTWSMVDTALINGSRSLTGGSSLPRFLHEFFGVPNRANLALLSEIQIAQWAKIHFEQIGEWPRRESGPIQEVPAETWKGVDMALIQGGRGLPGGSSLPKFLEEHFGVRNKQNLPKLTKEWICDRMRFHHEQTGKWPTENSGQLLDAPEETWKAVQVALYQGRRGLPGGSSVPRLLKERFGVPIRGLDGTDQGKV